MTATIKTRSKSVADGLSDVLLIDAAKCAAAGDMSVSWWHEEVRAGRAPQPVVRRPRCTRWRLADVRAFWQHFAELGSSDMEAAEAVVARATSASKAARAVVSR